VKVPILGITIDERFLEHRRRSTSRGGVACGVAATCLFAWRFYVDDFVSWDLLAVSITFVVVKLAVLIWYRLKD
jgi:hypothetical protein